MGEGACRGWGVAGGGREHDSISVYAQGDLDVSVTALSGVKGSWALRQYPLPQSRTQREMGWREHPTEEGRKAPPPEKTAGKQGQKLGGATGTESAQTPKLLQPLASAPDFEANQITQVCTVEVSVSLYW